MKSFTLTSPQLSAVKFNVQDTFQIPLGKSLHQLKQYMINQVGTRLLMKALNEIENGTAPRIPQLIKSPTLRARNLEKGEEKKIIDWATWDVKRVWHLVKGYSGILDFINYIDRPPFGHRIILQNYIECPIQDDFKGKSFLNAQGLRYVCCANGKIFYKYQFSLSSLLLSIRNLLFEFQKRENND